MTAAHTSVFRTSSGSLSLSHTHTHTHTHTHSKCVGSEETGKKAAKMPMKKQLTSVWFPQTVSFSTFLQGLVMGQNHIFIHSLGNCGHSVHIWDE